MRAALPPCHSRNRPDNRRSERLRDSPPDLQRDEVQRVGGRADSRRAQGAGALYRD